MEAHFSQENQKIDLEKLLHQIMVYQNDEIVSQINRDLIFNLIICLTLHRALPSGQDFNLSLMTKYL